jgi:hypothetical protein
MFVRQRTVSPVKPPRSAPPPVRGPKSCRLLPLSPIAVGLKYASRMSNASWKDGAVDVDPGWQLVRISFEGQQIDVAGANPRQVEWTSTGECITVAHPQYPRSGT